MTSRSLTMLALVVSGFLFDSPATFAAPSRRPNSFTASEIQVSTSFARATSTRHVTTFVVCFSALEDRQWDEESPGITCAHQFLGHFQPLDTEVTQSHASCAKLCASNCRCSSDSRSCPCYGVEFAFHYLSGGHFGDWS